MRFQFTLAAGLVAAALTSSAGAASVGATTTASDSVLSGQAVSADSAQKKTVKASKTSPKSKVRRSAKSAPKAAKTKPVEQADPTVGSSEGAMQIAAGSRPEPATHAPAIATAATVMPMVASINPPVVYAVPVSDSTIVLAGPAPNPYLVNVWKPYSKPLDPMSLIPVIKTVYPTGEKPLVVVSFKCPTELAGTTPVPLMVLREGINLGLDGLNRTNILAFNIQQVCR